MLIIRRIALAVLAAATVFAQVDVFYTGKTFGYLRVPDVQATDLESCSGLTSTGATKDFLSLLAKMREEAPAGAVMVGMGDNFGPNLYGRTIFSTKAEAPHLPKDFFIWPTSGGKWIRDDHSRDDDFRKHKATIPADNVGCFFRLAGYDAIVPGKHDFEAGPERLIQLANVLRKADGNLGETWMLGANLSISTKAPDDKPPLPLYQLENQLKHQGRLVHGGVTYSVQFPPTVNQRPTPSPKLPDVIFPWMREITVENAFELTEPGGAHFKVGNLVGEWKLSAHPSKAQALQLTASHGQRAHLTSKGRASLPVDVQLKVGQVELCKAVGTVRDSWGFLPAKNVNMDCRPLQEKKSEPEKASTAHTTGKIVYELPEALVQDTNYGLCIEISVKPPVRSCAPFYVSKPLFLDAANPQQALKPIRMVKRGGATVAIFGVVDPDTQNRIARMNYGWWNSDTRFETTVKISDPGQAILQAMMECEKTDGCTEARKVLLAQMPAFKARQMLANVDGATFDLVVAQTDPSNKTGEYEAVKNVHDCDASASFVVTPDNLFSDKTMDVPTAVEGAIQGAIQFARVGRKKLACGENQPAKVTEWSLKNTLPAISPAGDLPSYPVKIPVGTGAVKLRAAAEETLKKMLAGEPKVDDIKNWSNGQVLQRLALLLMQRRLHTDMAMIQSRDLYVPQVHGELAVDKGTLQEMLDRIFWKGDLTVAIPVTGATLKAILTQSAAYASQAEDPLNTDLEKGRSLATLGVFQEAAEKNWTVNTDVVDPGREYTVAFTDYLALGDTGYTALQTPSVPPPLRIKDLGKIYSISSMVCEEIKKNSTGLGDASCAPVTLKAKDYVDPSSERPPDVSYGFTQFEKSKAYLSEQLRRAQMKKFYEGRDAAEPVATRRAYWSLSVEKSDFSLNFNQHVHVPGAGSQNGLLAQRFTGVQVSAATAPNSYAIGFDNRVRLKRSWATGDWFALDDVAYSYTRTQGAGDVNSKSLSSNSLSFESGFTAHVMPWLKRLTVNQTDLLVSYRIDGQVFQPGNPIAIPAQTCSGDPANPSAATCPAGTAANAGGTVGGVLRRAVDHYAKLGIRRSDSRTWWEFGVLRGLSLNVPVAEQIVDASGNPALDVNGKALPVIPIRSGVLFPGNCKAGGLAASCPSTSLTGSPVDVINYLGFWGLIYNPAVNRMNTLYTSRDMTGVFLNFSINVPLPVGNRYTTLNGGKPIAFLAENTGRLLFNQHGDISTQTRYFDKLNLSIVIPALGNFTFAPEVDFVYYRNRVANLPFHSIDYLGKFNYTFDWRQGQRFRRAMRYGSPAPASTIVPSGK